VLNNTLSLILHTQ